MSSQLSPLHALALETNHAMDARYRTIVEYVLRRFTAHLGPRLTAAFLTGSVVRGDSLWGVSDLDLVIVFDTPTATDTALKQAVEIDVGQLPGGQVLVIQRFWHDLLPQMPAGVRAYWLYTCHYDSYPLYGAAPRTFLPAPPHGEELVKLIAPIIRSDGEIEVSKPTLTRQESRHLAKRILHGLALPTLATAQVDFIAPLQVVDLAFPLAIKTYLPLVHRIYQEAPLMSDPKPLQRAWQMCWDYLVAQGICG